MFAEDVLLKHKYAEPQLVDIRLRLGGDCSRSYTAGSTHLVLLVHPSIPPPLAPMRRC